MIRKPFLWSESESWAGSKSWSKSEAGSVSGPNSWSGPWSNSWLYRSWPGSGACSGAWRTNI